VEHPLQGWRRCGPHCCRLYDRADFCLYRLAAGEAMLVTWQGSAFNLSYVLGAFSMLIVSFVMLRGDRFGKLVGLFWNCVGCDGPRASDGGDDWHRSFAPITCGLADPCCRKTVPTQQSPLKRTSLPGWDMGWGKPHQEARSDSAAKKQLLFGNCLIPGIRHHDAQRARIDIMALELHEPILLDQPAQASPLQEIPVVPEMPGPGQPFDDC
jgi:hypothetical protein